MTPEPHRTYGISIHAGPAARTSITVEQAAVIVFVFRLTAIGWFIGRTYGFTFRVLPAELFLIVLDEME